MEKFSLFPWKPKYFTLVKGAGEGITSLNAFDAALLSSGIGNTNLVKISSILPPGVVYIESEKIRISEGSFIPVAYGHIESHTPEEIIAAAVAVGIPQDGGYGVIMEYSARGDAGHAESIVRLMVEEAFKMRGLTLSRIYSVAVEHQVERIGSVFAGVVLL